MEKQIAGKRSMECKQKQLGVQGEIKSNTGKSTRQGNLRHPWVRLQSFSNSASLVKRTIEILPSVVGDFPILYSPWCQILYVLKYALNSQPFVLIIVNCLFLDQSYSFYQQFVCPQIRVGREIPPVTGIPSGNYRDVPSWEIL